MTEPKDVQELESAADSCEIRVIRDDAGAVTGVEVVCDTAEARTAMAAAINVHELVVKARAKEQV